MINRSFILSVALLASWIVLPDVAVAKAARDVPARESLTDVEQARFSEALLAATNRARREHKLVPFRGLPRLDLAADDQAAYNALLNRSSHSSAIHGQTTPAERVRRHGITPRAVSENVASFGYLEREEPSVEKVAEELVRMWMSSPGHRANILNGEFTHLGTAVRIRPEPGNVWRVYGVQVFARLR